MSEEPVHESSEPRSRQGIATFFRRLARRFRAGEPVPADDEGTVTLEPPAEADLDVELTDDGENVTLSMDVTLPASEAAVDTEASASKATFEVYEDGAGDYRWRLVHRNGNIIADGAEGYSDKRDAENGLESVKRNAPGAHVIDLSKDEEEPVEGGSNAVFELYVDDAGDPRWRLVHDNGNIIADSGQGYSSKQKAKQGLNSVKENVPGAEVVESEE